MAANKYFFPIILGLLCLTYSSTSVSPTPPSPSHANKVMLALAECVKAIQGLTGQAKTSQAAQDLQQIVDATQATSHKQPQQCEESTTNNDNNNNNRLRVPRVSTPIPRLPSNASCHQALTNTAWTTIYTTTRITESARRKCSRKRQVGAIQQATTPLSTANRVRKRAQVETAAARGAPPSWAHDQEQDNQGYNHQQVGQDLQWQLGNYNNNAEG